MAHDEYPTPTYGLLAELPGPRQLLRAVERAQEVGYERLDAFTPYPIEEVCHLVARHRKSKVSLFVLLGGIVGAVFGFGLQTWVSVVAYPLNVGGRPYFSWPAFVPMTLETTILFAAFAAVIGMFTLNNLPQPYHPVFNVDRFERATQDAYFLLIEAADSRFDSESTCDFLEQLGASEVHDVDW